MRSIAQSAADHEADEDGEEDKKEDVVQPARRSPKDPRSSLIERAPTISDAQAKSSGEPLDLAAKGDYGASDNYYTRSSVGQVALLVGRQREEYAHALELRNTCERRLQKLELKQARFGINCPAEIEVEVDELREKIEELNSKITRKEIPPVQHDKADILSVEKQEEAIRAISQVLGISMRDITLINIILGSVILEVQVPLASAIHLLALKRLNHPRLGELGIANVILNKLISSEGELIDKIIDRAIRFEKLTMEAAMKSNEDEDVVPSPYAGTPGTAQLSITLAEK